MPCNQLCARESKRIGAVPAAACHVIIKGPSPEVEVTAERIRAVQTQMWDAWVRCVAEPPHGIACAAACRLCTEPDPEAMWGRAASLAAGSVFGVSSSSCGGHSCGGSLAVVGLRLRQIHEYLRAAEATWCAGVAGIAPTRGKPFRSRCYKCDAGVVSTKIVSCACDRLNLGFPRKLQMMSHR